MKYFSAIQNKWTTETHNNMDESQKDFGKQKKPDLKGYILYDSICMILWER